MQRLKNPMTKNKKPDFQKFHKITQKENGWAYKIAGRSPRICVYTQQVVEEDVENQPRRNHNVNDAFERINIVDCG